jgi:hypothetical protein
MSSPRLATVLSMLAIVLTVANLLLLLSSQSIAQPKEHVVAAMNVDGGEVVPLIKCRELQLVDGLGRRRSQLLVTQAVTVDGTHYPEGVLFRLIDTEGRPGIKISTDDHGAGILASGPAANNDWYGIQILAKNGNGFIRLKNADGESRNLETGN